MPSGSELKLISILLPLYDDAGHPQPKDRFHQTEKELLERFGGVTLYLRAPARGRWKSPDGSVDRDEIVICEVMAEGLDRIWWKDYRGRLAQRFDQKEMIVRASTVEPL